LGALRINSAENVDCNSAGVYHHNCAEAIQHNLLKTVDTVNYFSLVFRVTQFSADMQKNFTD
jgi:hypothetical protein